MFGSLEKYEFFTMSSRTPLPICKRALSLASVLCTLLNAPKQNRFPPENSIRAHSKKNYSLVNFEKIFTGGVNITVNSDWSEAGWNFEHFADLPWKSFFYEVSIVTKWMNLHMKISSILIQKEYLGVKFKVQNWTPKFGHRWLGKQNIFLNWVGVWVSTVRVVVWPFGSNLECKTRVKLQNKRNKYV
jgi:hypothetical protein